MRRRKRLESSKYKLLRNFKKKVNNERAGKVIRDHNNHLYRFDSYGSLRRLTREELEKFSRENDSLPYRRTTDT